jgi:hypothetical protein
MLSIRLRFLSAPVARQYRGRLLHSSPALFNFSKFNGTPKGKDPSLSQGYVTNPSQSAQHDPHSQAARSGLAQNKADENKTALRIDAASRDSMQKAPGAGKGNPEKLRLDDQVGSASGSSGAGKKMQGSTKNGSEEATLPGFFNALKKILGFKTSKKRDGVLDEPTEPPDSTRFVGRKDATGTSPASDKASGPKASGKPNEKNLPGEQHEHLTHKKEGVSGNVPEEPVLPSQRKERTSEGEDEPQRFRSGARG